MISLFRSFLFAFSGIAHALRFERNFRVEWLCGLVVLMIAELVPFDLWQVTTMVLLISLVLAFELLNSAVEKVCDSSGLEFSLAKKHAKDGAAGAVLVVACSAAVIFAIFMTTDYERLLSAMSLNPWPFFSIPVVFMLSLPCALATSPGLLRTIAFAAGVTSHVMLVVNHHENIFFAGFVIAFHLAWAATLTRHLVSLRFAKANA